MTAEEVRVALDLVPFDEFAAASRKRTQEMWDAVGPPKIARNLEANRRTGRSWRTMVDIVAALSEGKTVLYTCHTNRICEYNLSIIRTWATQLNITAVGSSAWWKVSFANGATLAVVTFDNTLRVEGLQFDCAFSDHWRGL